MIARQTPAVAMFLLATASTELCANMARAEGSGLACKEAFESAQLELRAHQPLAARDRFRFCASEACPGFLRRACEAALPEAEAAVPSVVLKASEGTKDLADVEVSSEEHVLKARLDGLAVELEPGTHVFAFRRVGAPDLTLTVLVAEGEKERPVAASWPAPAEVVATPSAPTSPASSAPVATSVPWSVWLAGGVTLAAAATGTTLALMANDRRAKLAATCKPFCSDEEVDGVSALYRGADAAFVVSGVALVSTALLFAFRPSTGGGRVGVTPLASAWVTGLACSGSF